MKKAHQLTGLLVGLGVLGGLVFVTLWDVGPDAAPSATFEPRLERTERTSQISAEEFARTAAEAPARVTPRAASGDRQALGEVAPVFPATLHVTNVEGQALPEAEFVVIDSGFEPLVRCAADSAGVIALPDRLPAGERYLSAPGYEVLMMAAETPPVLRRASMISVLGMDAAGRSLESGWRVRPIDTALRADVFAWLAERSDWVTPAAGRAQFEGRLSWEDSWIRPSFEFDLGARCTWIQREFDYDWDSPNDLDWHDPICHVHVGSHVAHELPQIRLLDDAGQALGDRRVELWSGFTFLRALFTGPDGTLSIDFHLADSVERDEWLDLRVEVRRDEWKTYELRLSEVRERGGLELRLSTKPIDVQLNGLNLSEFSVAVLADPLSLAEMQTDSHRAMHHSIAPSAFHRLDSKGHASVPTQSFAETRCVLLRHDPSGYLVDGREAVMPGALVEFEAPPIGQLILQGATRREDLERVRLTPKERWPVELTLIPTQHALVYQGPTTTWRLPFGEYDLAEFDATHRQLQRAIIQIGPQPTRLTMSTVSEAVPEPVAEQRVAYGRLRRTFTEQSFEGWSLEMHAPWTARRSTTVFCDKNGRFEIAYPASYDRQALRFAWTSSELKIEPGVRATWTGADHFELDFPIGCLEIVWPLDTRLRAFLNAHAQRMGPSALETLLVPPTLKGDLGRNSFEVSWRNAELISRAYLSPGRYEVTFDGVPWRARGQVDVRAGVRTQSRLPEPTRGMVSYAIDAPPLSSLQIISERTDDPSVFRADVIDQVLEHNLEVNANYPFEPGTYKVNVFGEWRVTDEVFLPVDVTLSLTVEPGALQEFHIDLSPEFRREARRALERHPELASVLNAYLNS